MCTKLRTRGRSLFVPRPNSKKRSCSKPSRGCICALVGCTAECIASMIKLWIEFPSELVIYARGFWTEKNSSQSGFDVIWTCQAAPFYCDACPPGCCSFVCACANKMHRAHCTYMGVHFRLLTWPCPEYCVFDLPADYILYVNARVYYVFCVMGTRSSLWLTGM